MNGSGYQVVKNKRKDVKIVTDGYSFEEHLDEGITYSNKGATGAIEVVLPDAIVGREIGILVETAESFKFVSRADSLLPTAENDGTTLAAAKILSAEVVGSNLRLGCVVANSWMVIDMNGAWIDDES